MSKTRLDVQSSSNSSNDEEQINESQENNLSLMKNVVPKTLQCSTDNTTTQNNVSWTNKSANNVSKRTYRSQKGVKKPLMDTSFETHRGSRKVVESASSSDNDTKESIGKVEATTDKQITLTLSQDLQSQAKLPPGIIDSSRTATIASSDPVEGAQSRQTALKQKISEMKDTLSTTLNRLETRVDILESAKIVINNSNEYLQTMSSALATQLEALEKASESRETTLEDLYTRGAEILTTDISIDNDFASEIDSVISSADEALRNFLRDILFKTTTQLVTDPHIIGPSGAIRSVMNTYQAKQDDIKRKLNATATVKADALNILDNKLEQTSLRDQNAVKINESLKDKFIQRLENTEKIFADIKEESDNNFASLDQAADIQRADFDAKTINLRNALRKLQLARVGYYQ